MMHMTIYIYDYIYIYKLVYTYIIQTNIVHRQLLSELEMRVFDYCLHGNTYCMIWVLFEARVITGTYFKQGGWVCLDHVWCPCKREVWGVERTTSLFGALHKQFGFVMINDHLILEVSLNWQLLFMSNYHCYITFAVRCDLAIYIHREILLLAAVGSCEQARFMRPPATLRKMWTALWNPTHIHIFIGICMYLHKMKITCIYINTWRI